MSEKILNLSDGEPSDSAVTGVILAGGLSRRMGRDKACMDISGETLVARVEKILRPLCAEVIIAGDRPDLARPELSCYPDIYPGSALGGLYTGLYHARTPWIFVSACDLPYASLELARALIMQRAGCDAVVIHTEKGWEPLFALYSKRCLKPMQRLLEQGNLRIYDCFPELRVCQPDTAVLPTEWERALTNLNTPEDVRQLVAEQPTKEQGEGNNDKF